MNADQARPAIDVPSIGDRALDDDHLELGRLIAALAVAPAADGMKALEALRHHAANHFETEDRDLRRLGGNNARCHLDEHAAVLSSLGEVRDILAAPTTEAARADELVQRLAAQLAYWLAEHVSAMDAGLAAARAKARFGGVPVRIERNRR